MSRILGLHDHGDDHRPPSGGVVKELTKSASDALFDVRKLRQVLRIHLLKLVEYGNPTFFKEFFLMFRNHEPPGDDIRA